MRYFIFAITVVCIVSLHGCKQEKEKQTEQIIQGTEEQTSSTTTTLPSFSDEYLTSVYESQELIKLDAVNADLRKKYCDLAYNKDQQIFVSMGIARLHNPETGQAIPSYLYERAAKMDAVRWASYGETWLKNNYHPPFGKIEKSGTRPVEIINSVTVGDSLFLFAATRF
jgi:hypothetical protein